jgi:phytoene dehydrogenase-like protein
VADKTYDVVIVGGGNCALVLGMYLTKYGGIRETVILEERNELGGSWETIENAVPGVPESTHAFFHDTETWRLPTKEDFPEFAEYGGEVLPHYGLMPCAIFKDGTATSFYTYHADPTGERSAAILGKYSQRDAEQFLAACELMKPGGKLLEGLKEAFCTAPDPRTGGPEAVFMRMVMDPECARVLDPQTAFMTPLDAYRTFFEAVENQIMPMRMTYSAGLPPLAATAGYFANLFVFIFGRYGGYVKGGTHSLAHAAQRIIKENGGEYFTRSRVDELIIENNAVKGVRLADGTEIGARKAVVSAGLYPSQLLDFLGRDKVSYTIRSKVDSILWDQCLIYWSWFVFNEKPHYKAADFMGIPDIDTAQWACPSSKDVYALVKQDIRRRPIYGMGMPPPYPDMDPPLNLANIHSGERADGTLDPIIHPHGLFNQLVEQHTISPVFQPDERWWHKHHEDMRKAVIDNFKEYTTNINEDSLVGYAPLSPWTISRLRNYRNGNMVAIDHDARQEASMRPIMEWAGYRVPWIKGLYCVGTAWWPGGFAGDSKAYNCYKVMAEDLGLRQPGKEKGRPY